jgi:hypothetical protein
MKEIKMAKVKQKTFYKTSGITLDYKASLNRPAWTSEQSTGMFQAYKHKHTSHRPNKPIIKDYYNDKKTTK